MLEKNKEYSFFEIINKLREVYVYNGEDELYRDNNWCLYSNDDDVNLNSKCYVCEYPYIDDDTYEERMPAAVVERQFELIYRDELLQDVIVAALKRKINVSNEELLQAIKYYDDTDSFFEL